MTDWVEINGAGFRYQLTGDAVRTLVLVHEMGGTLESWDLVLPLLRPDHSILRYDMRGAGLSTKIRGAGDIGQMADDIAALLDHCGRHGPITIAGGAVGGGIALHFASRHAHRTNGVVALAPATGVSPDRRAYTTSIANEVEKQGMLAIADASLARSYPEALREDSSRFNRLRARWLTNDPASYAAIYRMLANCDLTEDLANLGVPVLFLAGTYDPLRPPALIEPLSRTVPNGRFKELPTGHFMATQSPELVAAEINQFLGELAADS
jgi:3-oxoadipate enol-lactonase